MKGLNVKLFLKPGAAPGCKASGAVVLSLEQTQQCRSPHSCGTEGLWMVVQNNEDQTFEVKAEVAMPAARETLVALYRDYFSNYLTVETYAEQHGLLVDEARTLLELAHKVDSHPHPES